MRLRPGLLLHAESSMVEINATAAGHRTSVEVGGRLRITLAENVSTGYRWQLDPAACAASLHLDSDESTTPSGPPGAGGLRSWTFTARRAGRCELHFRSARAWEKTAAATSLTFPIAIEASK